MAQGSAKLSKPKKSQGSQKRKTVKAKSVSKGRKSFSAKGSKTSSFKDEIDTSKAINRKNESIVAAKAVSVGTRFFMSDVSEKGTKEMNKQLKERSKKQDKSTKLSDRLRDQLKKLNDGL
jgi:hypothetical protein